MYYSGAPHNGPPEKRPTSEQRACSRNGFETTLEVVHYESPRSGPSEFRITDTDDVPRPSIGVGIGGARGAMAPPIILVQMLCITVFEIIKRLCAAVLSNSTSDGPPNQDIIPTPMPSQPYIFGLQKRPAKTRPQIYSRIKKSVIIKCELLSAHR